MQQGFVDLRTDPEQLADNYWPAFADIMMVVVMIFMLASVILIIRNWELVAALRDTLESERVAQEEVRFASQENATLEEQLAQSQHQISVMRMKLMRASEQEQQQKQLLARKDLEHQVIVSELERTQKNMASLQQHNSQLMASLNTAQTALQNNESIRSRLQGSLLQAEQVTHDQAQMISQQTSEISELQQKHSDAQTRILALQGEYDTIKVAYEKLIKPARTARGKHVVEIRYSKRSGKKRIDYKDTGDAEYRRMSRKDLNKRLTLLKKEYPGKLYVKIIIPEKSGLSYNEAWQFTKEMLDRYDYYNEQ